MEGMRKEMASIRKLLEHQISGLMWQEVERREPMRALLIKELKKMGFDDAFADQLAGLIPEDMPIHQAMAQLAEVLTAQLKISEDDILRQGGAVALLGPTGVGKTTTIAKLAARFAMKYGAEQVALITTDNYRIGPTNSCRPMVASWVARCVRCAMPRSSPMRSISSATAGWCSSIPPG